MQTMSEVWKRFSKRVNDTLATIPDTSMGSGHMPLEYSDDEFQTAMKKLQQTALLFDDMPIYPINEQIAAKLIYDQLKGSNDKPDY